MLFLPVLEPGKKVSCWFVFSVFFFFAELLLSHSSFWKICLHTTVDMLQIRIYLFVFCRWNEFVGHILLLSLAKLVPRNSLTIVL